MDAAAAGDHMHHALPPTRALYRLPHQPEEGYPHDGRWALGLPERRGCMQVECSRLLMKLAP